MEILSAKGLLNWDGGHILQKQETDFTGLFTGNSTSDVFGDDLPN